MGGTLLYDIAFLVDKVDEEGNIIEGQKVEFQPEQGSVTIDFFFHDSRLSDELTAAAAGEVEVVHLPVDQEIMDALDTTADAVDISTSDIEAEVLTAEVAVEAEGAARDALSFTTDSFSVYAFRTAAGQMNYWAGSENYDIDDVYEMMGQATDFSVVARQLISYSHIEGNIAVETYTTKGTSGNLNEGGRLIAGNKVVRINVAKTITGGSGTFRFGVFTSPSTNQTEANAIYTFEIDAPDTFSLTAENAPNVFAALESKPVYIYELDGDTGRIVADGGNVSSDAGDTFRVKYETGNQVNNTALDNYIGYLDIPVDTTVGYNYFGPEGTMTYFGSGSIDETTGQNQSTVYRTPDHRLSIQGKGAWTTTTNPYVKVSDVVIPMLEGVMQNLEGASVMLANAANGPTASSQGLNVVNLISTTGNLTKDLDNANFEQLSAQGSDKYHGKGISSMLTDPEELSEYLLINIDATGFDTYNLTQLMIDGYTPDSDNQFSRLSSHMIFNFVERDAAGNFVPYRGKVTGQDVVGGLVLAPAAYVDQRGAMFGEVIGNVVDRSHASGEIHKKTITSKDREIRMEISNAGSATTVSLQAKKEFAGRPLSNEEGFAFTLKGVTGTEPMPAGTNPTTGKLMTMAAARNNWTASFGSISYTAAGTYRYTITEERGGTVYRGITYDPAVYDVVVNVGMQNGNLTASKTIVKRGAAGTVTEPVPFRNTYEATGKVTPHSSKELKGRTLTAGQFSFVLQETSSDFTTPVTGGVRETKTNDAYGGVVFSEISYVKNETRDDTGTHYYTITEVIPDAAVNSAGVQYRNATAAQKAAGGVWTLNGYSYDGHVERLYVSVADNEDGTLSVTEEYTRTDESTGNVFRNEYEAKGTAELLTYKDLSGEELSPGTFTFRLTAEGNAPMPADPTAINGNSGDAKTALFRKIDYTLADAGKTYTYYIQEVIPDEAVNENGKAWKNCTDAEKANGTFSIMGVTFDNHKVKVTVTVGRDQGNGVLTTTIRYDNGTRPYTFVNKYEASGSAILYAYKTVNGVAPAQNEQFTFELYASNANAAVPSGAAPLETVKNNGLMIAFAPITYNQDDIDKTFYYVIREKVTDKKTGYVLDSHDCLATVKVTKQASDESRLATVVSYSNRFSTTDIQDNVFRNTYSADGKLILSARKLLSGRSIRSGEFTFVLEDEAGNVIDTKTTGNAASSYTVEFKAINYVVNSDRDDSGSYTYRIREVIPEGATLLSDGRYYKDGMYYDAANVQLIDVTVVDDRDNSPGSLIVTARRRGETAAINSPSDPAATFRNEYEAEGDLDLLALKQLNGELPKAGSFEFVLTAQESAAPMPQDGVTTLTNRADGEVHFDTIHYTQDDIGKTYHYEIRETIPKDAVDNGNGTFTKNGYTYDGHTYQVTVTVADKEKPDGTLVITTTPADLKAADSRIFRNKYASKGSVTLKAYKSLNGDVPEDGTFAFTLFDVTGITDYAALGTDADRLLETRMNVGRNVSFSPINYTQDDVRKVFSYLILENIPADAVAVDDETLVYKNAGFLDKVSHEWKLNGYIYDGHYEHVTVSLTDNNDGTITATPTYDNEEGAFFENRYEAETKVNLKAKKFLNDVLFTTPGVFSFSLTGVNGAPVPANTTALNDENGEAVFGEIGYTLSDAGKTYEYVIREIIPDEAVNAAGEKYKDASQEERNAGVWTLSGLTYDGHASRVSVTLSDQGDGTLDADIVYADEEGLTEKSGAGLFYNIYEASSSITLGARKNLNGEPAPNGKFTFELLDAKGAVLQTKTNSDGGAVVFDEIQYDLDDLNGEKSAVFTYSIREVIPDDAEDASLGKTYAQATEQEKQNGTFTKDGITYDGHVMQVRVDVTDDGDGSLQAVSTIDPIEDAFFSNTYTATGSTDFLAHKTYEGHALAAGQFSFTITALDGGNLPAETTVRNDAKGSVTFGSVEYTQADLGGAKTKTFNYAIKENIPAAAVAKGNNAFVLNGVTYDGHTTNVKVTVTDKEDGTLDVVRVYDEKTALTQAEFTNSYAVSGSARLYMSKILNGREAADNEFTFRLYDETGKLLDEKTNNGGEVLFDRISYYQDKDHSDAGKDFTYKIREVIPDDAVNGSGQKYNDADVTDEQRAKDLWTKDGVTYDGHEITAVVQVRDTGRGSLITRVVYSAGEGENAQAFVNEYNAYGSIQPMAKKQLVGDKALKAGDFTFILEDASRSEIDRKPIDAAGVASFDEIVYDIEDAGETFTYYIREDIPADAVRNSQGFLVKDGIIYDESVWAFTVQVTDNEDGSLDVTGTYIKVGTDTAAEQPVFVNTEEKSQKVLLEIAKQLNGGVPTGHSFSFYLKDSEEALFDPAQHLVEQVTTDSARVSFSEITVDREGVFDYYMYEVIPDTARDETLGKTYREASDAEKRTGTWKLNGYTYDPTVVHATVTVESTADGTFTTRTEYDIDDTIVEQGVIHNLYEASGKVTLHAKKTAQPTGTAVPEGHFSFRLLDAEGKVLAAKANDANGLAAFDAIEYTEQDIGKTFQYAMQEVVPDDAVNAAGKTYAEATAEEKTAGGFVKDGWTYSAVSYDITVTVADKEAGKQDGNLVIHVTGTPELSEVTGQDTDDVSAQAGFVNTYTEGKVSTDFKAFKILTGQTLVKDQFSFTITALDGGKLPETTTVKNEADGNAVFGSVEYTEKDLAGEKTKTWNYSIKEDIPAEAVEQEDGTFVLNSITYDGHESKVAVTVTNNGDGTLSVSRIYDEDEKLTEAVFENVYHGYGSLEVTKHLKLDLGDEYDNLYAVDHTFKVALFEDEDCTKMIEGTERDLEFKDATAATVVYENLEAGKTCYVAELTQDDQGLRVMKVKVEEEIKELNAVCRVEFETTNEVKVERDGNVTRISFDNVFTEVPDNFYREAEITITKKTLKNGTKTKSNETFHAGIFADKELTELSGDVSANIIELAMNGQDEVTSDPVLVSVGKGASIDLYVAETDEEGNPVKKDASFKYTVSYTNNNITIDEEDMKASTKYDVTITNDEETVTPTPTPTPPTPPGVRTGDDTPIGTYLALLFMALAAVVIAGMALRRRKQTR